MDLFKYFFLKRREADISTYDWLEKEVAIDPVGMIKRIDYTVFLLMKKDQREIFAKWSNKVANEYGEILEQYPFFLEDISVLPYSKKEIETALYILIIIASLNKNEKMYEFILTNLIYLSDYVDINGKEKEELRKIKILYREKNTQKSNEYIKAYESLNSKIKDSICSSIKYRDEASRIWRVISKLSE